MNDGCESETMEAEVFLNNLKMKKKILKSLTITSILQKLREDIFLKNKS